MRYTTLFGALALIAMTTVRAQDAPVNAEAVVDAAAVPVVAVDANAAVSAEAAKPIDPSVYPSLTEIEGRVKIFNAYAVKNSPKDEAAEKSESKKSPSKVSEKKASSEKASSKKVSSKKVSSKKEASKKSSKEKSSKKHAAKVQHKPHANKQKKLSAQSVHKSHKANHPHAASVHKKNKKNKKNAKKQQKNMQAQCNENHEHHKDHDCEDDCIVYETIHMVPTCPPKKECLEEKEKETVVEPEEDIEYENYFQNNQVPQQNERLQFLRRG